MADDQLALVLNQQLAARMGEPDFMGLVKAVSQYEVQSSNIRVTTDTEYQMACDSLVAVASNTKALKSILNEIIAYPKLYQKLAKDAFKTLIDRNDKTRGKLEYHAKPYKAMKDVEYAKQQAEAAAVVEAQVVDADVEQPPPEAAPQPPMQSTKATNGGSVSFRAGRPDIEVINSAKLVRASISAKNKVPTDVISIDMAAVRRAVEADIMKPRQWEKYGVKVTPKEEMVLRT